MDVLLVQSNVMHFLWPRWGLDYGLQVLEVLERPRFSGRPVVIHAASIGGFTFTQTLTHAAAGRKEHAGLAQRVRGHIYDSLVVGTLEHMAIGERASGVHLPVTLVLDSSVTSLNTTLAS